MKVNINYGIQQSQKGVATSNKVSITIDMNDYESEFDGKGFTLRLIKTLLSTMVKNTLSTKLNPFEDAPMRTSNIDNLVKVGILSLAKFSMVTKPFSLNGF